MLTIKDFTTDHEHLTDLLSVATYGNEWPVIRVFKSDNEKGLFANDECREDKWATALLKGKGVMVYDCYDEDAEDCETLADFPKSAKHHLTLKDIKKGLELMRDEYPHHFADLVSGNDDAITGDVFLQLATFGELIYG